ncbi:MAG: asparagine synthase (glutamine-hydrolyzing) [Hyphomicrobium sp.]
MCGINGIFAYHYAANPICRDELIRTRDHMAARGPDGCGAWVSDEGSIGFGHRRLSIIDLSETGAQPMVSADGQFVVTFNGEIYNYRALREDLEAKGRVFRSTSDTEVLLHLYAERGASFVRDLRGMFAFAIWDRAARRVLLARDPYGIKPLYYANDGWTLRFASQVKALLAGGKVSRDPEPAGEVGFYLWGSVPEPFTMYREVRAVPAGSTVLVDRLGPHEPQRFFSIAEKYCEAESSRRNRSELKYGERHATIRAALLDSVRHHLVADVPVGAFLSAGIDSTSLVGLMRDAGQHEIQTVTLTFEEFRGRPNDEAPLAEYVAELYDTRHSTRVITETEFAADLPAILEAMDQPSIDGINTWFVSKAAHEHGLKVAISGLGGDELFGGYPSFRDIPRWVNMFSLPSAVPLFGSTARECGRMLTGAFGANPKAASLIEYGGTYAGAYMLKRGLYLPWELESLLDRDLVREGLRRLAPLQRIASVIDPMPQTAFGRVAALESSLYMRNQLLRDTDWTSMAHSLEVRVPLVDSQLLGDVTAETHALQGGDGKAFLAGAPTRPLPDNIAKRAKTGFTTPIEHWMKKLLSRREGSKHAGAPATKSWARDWSSYIAKEVVGIA